MNKYIYILLIALSLNIFSVQAQDIKNLNQQYHSFWQSLKLIPKCYIQKLPCSKEEQRKANQVLVQGGLLIAGVVVLFGGYRGVGFLTGHYRNKEAKEIIARHIPRVESVVVTTNPYAREGDRLIITIPEDMRRLYLFKDEERDKLKAYVIENFRGISALDLNASSGWPIFSTRLLYEETSEQR